MYRWMAILMPVLLAGLPGGVSAQGDLRDTSIFMVPITASYAYQVPTFELNERFGANNNVGLSAGVKFRNNYLLGIDGSFIFGNRIHEPGLLQNVTNSQGEILDAEGQVADVLLFERGYMIMGWAGKIIPVVGPNPNSGMLVKIGGGYLRHKIRVETQNNVVPQLEDDYLTGYDRLCAGPAVMMFAGYQHFGNNRLVNFMVGFEMVIGFTRSLRAYNFDTGRYNDEERVDGLNGFRFGWTLPIYRRTAQRFFYN